jgi:hypothetical protein
MNIDYRKLDWPTGLNLEALKDLDTLLFHKLICERAKEKIEGRRIVLPSWSCIRKIICHKLWAEILAGKRTWDSTKKALIKEFNLQALKDIGFTKTKVEAFYLQREAEIKKEKEKRTQ